MWLTNSSIGRKVVMSVTGIALVLFLTFHASMNVVALISAKGYNAICEFLGANWYAVVATIGLAALVALHFIFAIWLTIQNRKARGNSKYAVTDKPAKVEWASQNMLVLGFIVCGGLLLHLFNFWWNMMATELGFNPGNGIEATDGVGHIINTFQNPVYVAIYIVWLLALWFHLTHGIWSSMQTLGVSGKIWFKRWRCIGTIFSTLIIGMFMVVAVAFFAGWRPCEMKCCGECCGEKTECCEAEGACCGQCEQGEGVCCAEKAECCAAAEGACCAETASEEEVVAEHNHMDKAIHADCPACAPALENGAN